MISCLIGRIKQLKKTLAAPTYIIQVVLEVVGNVNVPVPGQVPDWLQDSREALFLGGGEGHGADCLLTCRI